MEILDLEICRVRNGLGNGLKILEICMEGTRFFGYPPYKLEFSITRYPTRFAL